jgi:hypothetical protein
MSQQLVTENRFAPIIEIIEQNKHKYRFIRSTYADSINGRCTLGLIASHFGWGGKDTTPGINTIKEYTELTSPKMRSFIARLNDTCWSYEEVIDKLRTCDYPTEIKEMSEQIVTGNRFAKFIMLIRSTIVLAGHLNPILPTSKKDCPG